MEQLSWVPDPEVGEVGEVPESLNDYNENCDVEESDAESEHSDHLSDSEQSADEDLDDFEHDDPENCIFGKDKCTVWHLSPPRQNVLRKKENIATHLPVVKNVAKLAKTPMDCWNLFFSDSMIETIVQHTNRYLNKSKKTYTRARDVREVDIIEIRALLGLLYMAGIKKAQHPNLEELWATDGTGVECMRATMSKERFLLLLRALRFDNFENRAERKVYDNLAAIRDVLEDFKLKCINNYQVGEYSTIDEMLEPFHGRCKFRQYIPSKPAEYGIKVFSLADARTFYTSTIEVHSGKQPDGRYKIDNNPGEVVKRLSSHILGSGRNITMDNYFTSIPLARDLLKEKTTIVGTIRKNKKEIPPSFIATKQRALNSSMFGFTTNETIVSYKVKQNKVVLLLSTMHNDNKIDESTGDKAKPEILTFYNLTKGGVDIVDGMKALYSVARVSCRWPLTLFFTFLDVGGINSQIIYKANTGNLIKRREYLKTLALSLMKGHLIARSTIPNLPIDLKMSAKRIAGVQEDLAIPEKKVYKGFCAYCPRRKNKKTTKECGMCHLPICPSHSNYLCLPCANDENQA